MSLVRLCHNLFSKTNSPVQTVAALSNTGELTVKYLTIHRLTPDIFTRRYNADRFDQCINCSMDFGTFSNLYGQTC